MVQFTRKRNYQLHYRWSLEFPFSPFCMLFTIPCNSIYRNNCTIHQWLSCCESSIWRVSLQCRTSFSLSKNLRTNQKQYRCSVNQFIEDQENENTRMLVYYLTALSTSCHETINVKRYGKDQLVIIISGNLLIPNISPCCITVKWNCGPVTLEKLAFVFSCQKDEMQRCPGTK